MHSLLGALLLICLTTTTASSPPPHSLTPSLPHSIFDFQARDLSGATLSLSSLRGKRAFLVVNVASQCGLTDSNYEELQVLHAKYSEHLEILAFPCNNFLYQEPGTSEDIAAFVESKHAGFRVLEKVDCGSSASAHPLFPFLTTTLPDTGMLSYLLGDGIKWNFAKFLCDANGVPIKRYGPKTSPLSIEDDIVSLLQVESAGDSGSHSPITSSDEL